MIYMKHPEHGNAHFDEALQAEKEAQGWVKWPRTPEQKAGLLSVADVTAAVVVERRGPGRPRKAQQ